MPILARTTQELHGGGFPAGAITTVFEFPNSCPSFMAGHPWSQNLDCALPYWDTYSKGTLGWHMHFYSPAICPKGYTIACTRPLAGLLGPPVEIWEQAYFCLPGGYGCAESPTTLYATASVGDIPLIAPIVQIRWAESDIPNLETHPLNAFAAETDPAELLSTTGHPTTTGADPANPTEVPSISLPDETSPASTGASTELDEDTRLPMAAKAGIAVGVSVGILIAILIGVMVWRACRKREKNAEHSNTGASTAKDKYTSITSPMISPHQPIAVQEVNDAHRGPLHFQPSVSPVVRIDDPSHIDPSLGPLGQNPTHGYGVTAIGATGPVSELPTDGHEVSTSTSQPVQLETGETQVIMPEDQPVHTPVFGPIVAPPWSSIQSAANSSTTRNVAAVRGHDTPQSEASDLLSEPKPDVPIIAASNTRVSPRSPGMASSIHSGATGSATHSELASLYRRDSELQSKRERLVQLKEVDDEQEMIRRRIQELQETAAQGQ